MAKRRKNTDAIGASLSPGVAAFLADGQAKGKPAEERAEAARRARAKAEREKRKREYDERRSRAIFDLPQGQITEIARLSKEFEASRSEVVRWLIEFALAAYRGGSLPRPRLVSTGHFRFKNELVSQYGEDWRRYLREPEKRT